MKTTLCAVLYWITSPIERAAWWITGWRLSVGRFGKVRNLIEGPK